MILRKLSFWINAERIGPDLPLTHLLLYSKRLGQWLSKRKFYQFGVNSEIRPFSYCVETKKISIGDHVIIRPGTHLFASNSNEFKVHIRICDYALIGSGVHIYVSNHNYKDSTKAIFHQGHSLVKPVVLGKGSWIGANAIILPGVTIGENAVVGANSVVTKDVPDRGVAVGNPAKVVRIVS